MKEMKRRERVATTLDHKESDRVPMDVSIKLGAYSKLVRYLGLEYQVDLEPERRKNGQECTNR